MHDFTATDRHIILVLQPWVFETHAMPVISGLAWRPEMGTQVMVLDKDDLSQRRLYGPARLLPFPSGRRLGRAGRDDPFRRGGQRRIRVSPWTGRGCWSKDAGVVPGDPARLALVTLYPDGRRT